MPYHSPTTKPRPEVRLIRKQQLLKKVQLSDPTVWRMEREGRFPKRLQIGANSVAWIEAEVDEWIANLAATRKF